MTSSMANICPHCRVGLNWKAAGGEEKSLGSDADGSWTLRKAICPACNRMILYLINKRTSGGGFESSPSQKTEVKLVHPRTLGYYCPPNVPEEIEQDFREAWLVLNDSPKASAALSRRCLQNILQELAGIKSGNLAAQIEEAIEGGTLPPNITRELHAIRNIGMFAAHPKKSQVTGEIVPVEPRDAQWCLSIVSQILYYFCVALPASEKRVDELNQKLKDVGKPPINSEI